MKIEIEEIGLKLTISDQKLLELLGNWAGKAEFVATMSPDNKKKQARQRALSDIIDSEITCIGNKAKQRDAIQRNEEQQKELDEKWEGLHPDRKDIYAAWNENPFIVNLTSERDVGILHHKEKNRNFPVPREEFLSDDAQSLLRMALRENTASEIMESIGSYFECCSMGGHIWDGKNHGFKNLIGFLKKVRDIAKSKGEAWWENSFRASEREEPYDDANEAITGKLIKAYGCGEVKNPSDRYKNIIAASARIAKTMRKTQPFTEDKLIKFLVRALTDDKEHMPDKRIYPGQLCSDRTWNIVLPQFLKKNLGYDIET